MLGPCLASTICCIFCSVICLSSCKWPHSGQINHGTAAHQENLHLPIQTNLPNDCLLSAKTITQNTSIYEKIRDTVAYIVTHLCSAQTIDVNKTLCISVVNYVIYIMNLSQGKYFVMATRQRFISQTLMRFPQYLWSIYLADANTAAPQTQKLTICAQNSIEIVHTFTLKTESCRVTYSFLTQTTCGVILTW